MSKLLKDFRLYVLFPALLLAGCDAGGQSFTMPHDHSSTGKGGDSLAPVTLDLSGVATLDASASESFSLGANAFSTDFFYVINTAETAQTDIAPTYIDTTELRVTNITDNAGNALTLCDSSDCVLRVEGISTFTRTTTFENATDALILESNSPVFSMFEEDATTNEGNWSWAANSNELTLRAETDAGSPTPAIKFGRAAGIVDEITFGFGTASGRLSNVYWELDGSVQYRNATDVTTITPNTIVASGDSNSTFIRAAEGGDFVNMEIVATGPQLEIIADGGNTTTITADFFRTGSFSAETVGCVTEDTITIEWQIVGDFVSLHVPGASCTSDATDYYIDSSVNMPADIVPSGDRHESVIVEDNGTDNWGAAFMDALENGDIIFFNGDVNRNSFTASGTKGYEQFTINYRVN